MLIFHGSQKGERWNRIGFSSLNSLVFLANWLKFWTWGRIQPSSMTFHFIIWEKSSIFEQEMGWVWVKMFSKIKFWMIDFSFSGSRPICSCHFGISDDAVFCESKSQRAKMSSLSRKMIWKKIFFAKWSLTAQNFTCGHRYSFCYDMTIILL